MTRRHVTILVAVSAVVATLVTAWLMVGRSRAGRRTITTLQGDVVTLTVERDRLRAEVVAAVDLDRRLTGGPDKPLRIGIPTTLARTLVSTLVAGVIDQVSLTLGNLRVRKVGEVRRVVTLGNFDLTVRVKQVNAKLGGGAPDLQFGGNQMRMVMPVRVESGTGSAEIDFLWHARGIGGAVCGDMSMREVVTGTVTPSDYRLAGTLQLSTTDDAIVVTPRMPPLRIRVRVVPSKASWDLVQKTLDSKRGLCGFVIDRVNIPEALEGLLARGFHVRLPIEKLRPVAVPIGFAQTVMVRGTPVQIGVKADGLLITSDMIWLGADVTLATLPIPVPAPAGSATSFSAAEWTNRREPMRKVIVGAFVSMDGVMQAPGGPEEDPTGGFTFGGWVAPHADADPVFGSEIGKLFGEPFDLLLGRRTYEIFAAHWPYAEEGPYDDIATTFNRITKYVATRKGVDLTWKGSVALRDAARDVAKLKQEDGPALVTQGSTELVHALLGAGLVDEIRTFTFPVVLGKGKRLFGDESQPRAFKLTHSAVSENGLMAATYLRGGEVQTATIGGATEPSAAELARREKLKREG